MSDSESTWLGHTITAGGRTFRLYREVDGYYAESAGGTLLGPFDNEAMMRDATLRELSQWQPHGTTQTAIVRPNRRALPPDGPSVGADVPGGGAI